MESCDVLARASQTALAGAHWSGEEAAMRTEIPREHWPEFLGRFGQEHLGWRTRLESRRPGCGKLIEVENSFLQQVTDEQAGDHEQISIVLGDDAAHMHETHVVDDPMHVLLSGTEPSRRELEIDARDGTVTVISLRDRQSAF
jgi:hypothetical protein